MKAFANLYSALDETTATSEKVSALVRYLAAVPSADAAWAVHFLIGRRPTRLVSAPKLREWAAAEAGVPEWLFEESYHQVGDLAETVSLLIPDGPTGAAERTLAWWVEQRLLPLRGLPDVAQRALLVTAWRELEGRERFVWTKLLTGSFRVGASERLVVRALATLSGITPEAVAHRLMGAWEPTAAFYESLIAPDTSDADRSRPYPFYLAHSLEGNLEELGPSSAWQAEWKWDGIRAQLVRRDGATWLWSRGEELLSGRFPEIEEASRLLPDGTTLDGELLAWRDDAPQPFALLQQRIMRKAVSRKMLGEIPVILMAYDVLELAGADVRSKPLVWRREALRALLESIPSHGRFLLSPLVPLLDWNELALARAEARARGAEGIMLKRIDSPYGVGRRRGDWWKWKVDPLSLDAVLVYAQAGHGRRAGLYTDYTFAVRDGDALVPFAKAYSGLTDEEIRRVDAFVRANTLERFGPVRTVRPELVFEIAFEGIQRSTRHKSGVAVRFPRIARWRTDKRAQDADTIESLR
ncbi:MAG: ATP-dependent DNA ligase, partial [Gemmatimonadota bacterium]